jgi:hypothetical protein
MISRIILAFAALLLGPALSACSDPPPLYGDKPVVATGGPTAGPDMAMLPPDLAMDVYPSGPYGNQVGDIVEDIDLPGYHLSVANNDPSKVPWEDHIKLSQIRSEYRTSKCMWLAVDAFW